jgi:hypothetical protein
MDEQLTIGDELRDRGMARAVSNSDREFVHQVDLAIARTRQYRPLFTAEDVREQLEAAYGSGWPTFGLDRNVSKVIGARMNAQARKGYIRTTGMTTKATRPEAHSRRLLIWTRGNA